MTEQFKWSYIGILVSAVVGLVVMSKSSLKTQEHAVKLTSINDDSYIFTLVKPGNANLYRQESCTVTNKADKRFLNAHKGTIYKANVRFRIGDESWSYCSLTKESEQQFKHAIDSFFRAG